MTSNAGRRREIHRVIRWTNNLALVVADTVFLRLWVPIIAVGLAVLTEYCWHLQRPACQGT